MERPATQRRRLANAIATAAVWAIVIVAQVATGQGQQRKQPERQRSRPPAGAWDRATAETFVPDAFASLHGPRPTFANGARTDSPATPSAAVAPGADVRWSKLVSEETLTDEIKDARARVVGACDTQADFMGGGFEQARTGFGSLAMAFGVIAAYDHEIRWKRAAETARDLFARAGGACQAGSIQSFAESKARLEDLEALLDGDTPQGRPARDSGFRWSQVATRPTLMIRLQEAQDSIRPAVASRAQFGGSRSAVRHAAEIVAMIGEVIRQPDFEDHDDDAYRAHAAAMRDAAIEARSACDTRDYDAARAALGRLEKACQACHGEYRG